MKDFLRENHNRYIAEFAGTFVLVFFGCGAIIIDDAFQTTEPSVYALGDVTDRIHPVNAEAAVPKSDAAKAARMIVEGLKRFTIWKEQES